jgi:hypothetical protein
MNPWHQIIPDVAVNHIVFSKLFNSVPKCIHNKNVSESLNLWNYFSVFVWRVNFTFISQMGVHTLQPDVLQQKFSAETFCQGP